MTPGIKPEPSDVESIHDVRPTNRVEVVKREVPPSPEAGHSAQIAGDTYPSSRKRPSLPRAGGALPAKRRRSDERQPTVGIDHRVQDSVDEPPSVSSVVESTSMAIGPPNDMSYAPTVPVLASQPELADSSRLPRAPLIATSLPMSTDIVEPSSQDAVSSFGIAPDSRPSPIPTIDEPPPIVQPQPDAPTDNWLCAKPVGEDMDTGADSRVEPNDFHAELGVAESPSVQLDIQASSTSLPSADALNDRASGGSTAGAGTSRLDVDTRLQNEPAVSEQQSVIDPVVQVSDIDDLYMTEDVLCRVRHSRLVPLIQRLLLEECMRILDVHA
ncbi:hypothetical protein B0H21DRAFT_230253 [Amylocystis lapponica]|nr:hypothetical protein B0H21DRAFT_230253 [Amylocystis lapponica]